MENALWNNRVAVQGEGAAWTGTALHSQPHPPPACLPITYHPPTYLPPTYHVVFKLQIKQFWNSITSLLPFLPSSPSLDTAPCSLPNSWLLFLQCVCVKCVCLCVHSQVHKYNLFKLHNVSCMRMITCYWTTNWVFLHSQYFLVACNSLSRLGVPWDFRSSMLADCIVCF